MLAPRLCAKTLYIYTFIFFYVNSVHRRGPRRSWQTGLIGRAQAQTKMPGRVVRPCRARPPFGGRWRPFPVLHASRSKARLTPQNAARGHPKTPQRV